MTMNALEIQDQFFKEREEVLNYTLEKGMALRKSLRKGMGKMVRKGYRYTSRSLTQYWIAIVSERNKTYAYGSIYRPDDGMLIELPFCKDNPVDIPNAYTQHFLRRYAERILGNPDLTPLRTFVLLMTRTDVKILLHQSGADSVYAGVEGLFMNHRDQDRDLDVSKTCVSLDMMKQSQSEAYRKMADLLERSNEELQRNGRTFVLTDVGFLKDCQRLGIDIGDIYRDYDKFFRHSGFGRHKRGK